jgi:hypothetical protein
MSPSETSPQILSRVRAGVSLAAVGAYDLAGRVRIDAGPWLFSFGTGSTWLGCDADDGTYQPGQAGALGVE